MVSERIIIPKDFFMMVTPTGEADFVKYIQTLPGVAGGSDGSSSYYIRCDLSAVLEIKTRFPHNPFTLSYDPDTKQWQQISLLPIMPSLKYSISF
jgi:hypothetical protein